jgi:hypothetical protein
MRKEYYSYHCAWCKEHVPIDLYERLGSYLIPPNSRNKAKVLQADGVTWMIYPPTAENPVTKVVETRSVAIRSVRQFRTETRDIHTKHGKIHATFPRYLQTLRTMKLLRKIKGRTINLPHGRLILGDRSHPENIEFELSQVDLMKINKARPTERYGMIRCTIALVQPTVEKIMVDMFSSLTGMLKNRVQSVTKSWGGRASPQYSTYAYLSPPIYMQSSPRNVKKWNKNTACEMP